MKKTVLVPKAIAGEHGRHWYSYARENIQRWAKHSGYEFEVVCDVLAITSPRVHVKRNWRLMEHVLLTGTPPPDMMRNTKAALTHYWNTGEIRGPKTSAFARALKGDEDAVVLDVWMARVFGVDEMKVSNKSVYTALSGKVVRASRKLGWAPAQTQAALWTYQIEKAGHHVGAYNGGV